MHALVLKKINTPLILEDVPKPSPGHCEVLIKVIACGVCRTDLHIIDGELLTPLPIILGHQIIGIIEQKGNYVTDFQIGDTVGVAWLGSTCGYCSYCLNKQENLCDRALFNGFSLQGGFAQYTLAHYQYIYPLASQDPHLAPLLCAGMIGYRALKKCGTAKKIGFYGFGASAHILIQIALSLGKEIYAFTRPGDIEGQAFARSLHAAWAGDSNTQPPCDLDAAIIFASVGSLIPIALSHVSKGGIVVCAGIHMTDTPPMPYGILWGERTITTVANLTRQDAYEFLQFAPIVHTKITTYPLAEGNQAISDIRQGKLNGSAVLLP